MLAAAEIQKMSCVEKLHTMELLWSSFATDPDQIPSPEWHGTVLQTRLEKVEAGKGNFLTISELKSRLNPSRK